MKNNARITDPTLLIEAGIDPKTGLPIKCADGNKVTYKQDIKRQLRIIDEADAINRFTWFNLPDGLNSRLIERILYYRGQGMFFELNDKAYFLPYCLQGTIDVYGRYLGVSPLPFNGTANDGKEDSPWIQGLIFNPCYDVQLPEDFIEKNDEEIEDFIKNSCVILKDYSEQYSQKNIARQILNDPILDIMAECFPFMRTALINSTGVKGMRVGTENESADVYAANNALYKAALSGEQNVPIVGNIDFQMLCDGNVAKSEEFLLAMQSLDNYRLSLYGLDNGGLFQKKSHMLEAEQAMNTGNVGLIMRDSLQYRQEACTIANSIFGWNMWVEPSETVLNMDTTGDGIAGDDEAGQNEYIQEEVIDE